MDLIWVASMPNHCHIGCSCFSTSCIWIVIRSSNAALQIETKSHVWDTSIKNTAFNQKCTNITKQGRSFGRGYASIYANLFRARLRRVYSCLQELNHVSRIFRHVWKRVGFQLQPTFFLSPTFHLPPLQELHEISTAKWVKNREISVGNLQFLLISYCIHSVGKTTVADCFTTDFLLKNISDWKFTTDSVRESHPRPYSNAPHVVMRVNSWLDGPNKIGWLDSWHVEPPVEHQTMARRVNCRVTKLMNI